METDLERRRLAIADALRAIMAEPLPPRRSQPTFLRGAAPVTAPAAAAARAEDRMLIEEWDTAELTDGAEPVVPPLESVGSMSRMASLALFGHA